MNSSNNKKQIILTGKFSDIIEFLKESQKKYIYVNELIDALHSKKNNSAYIN